jgi:dihydroorotate dehydrogenase (NAD+) catalytic subunit
VVSFHAETVPEVPVAADLSIQLAPNNPRGLALTNPVMTASGTFGYGTEYEDICDVRQLGGIVCKGTTLEPREGNPQPRLMETPAGVLNSIGLQNIGVEALIRDKAPVWEQWSVPVIVNIAGDTVEEYGELARRLDAVEGVRGLEVNVSCPNVKAGGAIFGADPKAAAAVTAAVRRATTLPVIVKLTPNNTDIRAAARAVAEAGADALTVTNSLKGMVIDVETRKPVFANETAGLSGPAIRPLALALVWDVCGEVDLPVIGCGGISAPEDALAMLMAGARAVQVGSATYANPKAALEVIEGIDLYLERHGLSLTDIVGAARR